MTDDLYRLHFAICALLRTQEVVHELGTAGIAVVQATLGHAIMKRTLAVSVTVADLSRMTGLDRRTVNKALQRSMEFGWIAQEIDEGPGAPVTFLEVNIPERHRVGFRILKDKMP